MDQLITTTYLEMLTPDALIPSRQEFPELRIEKVEMPCGDLNRFLYTAVGREWSWTDRLVWSHADWQSYAEWPEIETWMAMVRGTPAGYFELASRWSQGAFEPGNTNATVDVEIASFGLLPMFIGGGYGGVLLTEALYRAWQVNGTARVWVHTCTLDGPNALANYKARGFTVYRAETDA